MMQLRPISSPGRFAAPTARVVPPGLLAMMAGALITETAITRVCPLNEALGVDTARRIRLR